MQPPLIIMPPAPAATLTMTTKIPSHARGAKAKDSIFTRDVKNYAAHGYKNGRVISSGYGLIWPGHQGKA